MKKVLSLLLFLTILSLIFTSCNIGIVSQNADKLSVVTTIFPYFDFAREITKDRAEVTMLISPGTESHDYEPSPQDIIKINQSDIFIYNGGESDEWVHSILNSIDNDVRVLCMFDYITLLCSEDHHSHHEHSHNKDAQDEHNHSDYDEHIWTSPVNAVKLVNVISEEIIAIDKTSQDFYSDNLNKYVKKLNKIDYEVKDIVNKTNENTLVFADRFPMLYFTEEYGIEHKSAFPGCSSETQPSISTVTEIIDFVNHKNISVVLHMDNSNANFAKLVSEDTGAKVKTFYSCHNVTKEQFENGVSYISLMKSNIEVLKEAL